VFQVARDNGHAPKVREGLIPWMLTKLDKPSPAVNGSTDPHFNIRAAVILPVVVIFRASVRVVQSFITGGIGQEPECVQRRRHLPQEQEVVGEPGKLHGERAVTGFATDPEVDAGRRSPEAAPAAREHAGASHLPCPQERPDLVEELVREGAETVIGGSSISLDSINFGFLARHFVEQIVCASALDGRGVKFAKRFLRKFALHCRRRTRPEELIRPAQGSVEVAA
jgi:hypothetical protein